MQLTLTDIPYDGVNRAKKIRVGTAIREISKGDADVITFDVKNFLESIFTITTGTIIVFCGINQVSEIFDYFFEKQIAGFGSVRHLIWHKTNPSPMNGENLYLSATENAIWFRKHKATFNARCKHNVFEFPAGSSELHPTEKNHALLADLILDNSNVGDTVFDPCAGSGSTLLIARKLGRNFIGCELNNDFYQKAKSRLDDEVSQVSLYDLFGNNPYKE